MNAIEMLALFNIPREDRQGFVIDVVNALEEGNVEPLQILYEVKVMAKIIDMLTTTDPSKNKTCFVAAERFKEIILDEANKYGSKEKFGAGDSDMRVGEVGVKYHFEACGDTEWEMLNQQVESLTAQRKSREDILKAVPIGGMDIPDKLTGEVIHVYPPSKTSTTTVIVTLK